MKTKQLKRHIRKIRFNWFFVTVFAVIAVFCILSSAYLTEYLYDRWLAPEGTELTQEINIQRAIRLHPTRTEGYARLLDLYTADDTLSENESAQLQQVLKDHQARLNKSPENVEQLYRDIAFVYLTRYEGDAEARFKMAYGYFQRSGSYSGENPLEDTATDTYLTIGRYYSEYLWLSGTTKEPSALESSDIVRQLSTMTDSFLKGSLDQRLAYSCTVADLLTQHSSLWQKKIDSTPIYTLVEKICAPLELSATSKCEKRLYDELSAWRSRWEETP